MPTPTTTELIDDPRVEAALAELKAACHEAGLHWLAVVKAGEDASRTVARGRVNADDLASGGILAAVFHCAARLGVTEGELTTALVTGVLLRPTVDHSVRPSEVEA